MTGWEIALKALTPATKILSLLKKKLEGNFTIYKALHDAGIAQYGDFKDFYRKALGAMAPTTHPSVITIFDKKSIMNAFDESYRGVISQEQLHQFVLAQISADNFFSEFSISIGDDILIFQQYILKVILENLDPSTQYLANRITDMEEKVDDIKSDTDQTLRMVKEIYAAFKGGFPKVIDASKEVAIERGDFNEDIEDILTELAHKRNESVIRLLEGFRRRHWDKLSTKQRYKVDGNLAIAYTEMGDIENAAKYMVLLPDYLPSHEEALGLAAMGYALTDNIAKAQAFIQKAQAVNPFSPHAAVAKLISLPEIATISEIETILTDQLRANPMVALHAAMQLKDRGPEGRLKSMKLLESIDLIGMEETLVYYEVLDRKGAVITMIAVDEYLAMLKLLKPEIIHKLETARDLFTQSWQYFKETDLKKSKWDSLANRGVVNKLLGKRDEAEQDFLASLQQEKRFFTYHNLLEMYLQDGRDNAALVDEIRNSIKLTPAEHEEVLFMELNSLLKKGQTEQILTILEKADLGNGRETNYKVVFFSSLALVDLGRSDDALKISTDLADAHPSEIIPNFQAAHIASVLQKPDIANVYAEKLMTLLKGDEGQYLLEMIVTLLYNLARYDDVVKLLDCERFKNGHNGFTSNLVNSLVAVGRVGDAVALLEQLHDHNTPNLEALHFLINACDTAFDYATSEKYVAEGVKAFPDNGFFHGKMIAQSLRDRKPQEARGYLQKLSSAGWSVMRQLEALAVAIPSVGSNHWASGLEIAMELRNSDFINSDTNKGFIMLMENMRRNGYHKYLIDEIVVGSTVQLQATSGDFLVITIGDPQLIIKAMALDHPLAHQLIGCRVNDQVVINQMSYQVVRILGPDFTLWHDCKLRLGL